MLRAPASRTSSFRALDYAFGVRSNDARLGAYLEELFAPLACASKPQHRYTIRAIEDGSPGTYELTLDGRTVTTGTSGETLIGPLVHSINREAITSAPFLLLHAGGVERDGYGVVLPAHMEAGKTTLVAALVRAGFGYLTDEAVAFDWDSHRIEPYPKPLSIDPGAWPLFPELEPQAALPSDDYKAAQWQVPPDAIRPDALGKPCLARFVVFPRYQRDAQTTLVRLGRAEALVELAKNTFEFKDQARRALDALDGIVREADCFRLSMGDLDGACELVIELTEQARVSS